MATLSVVSPLYRDVNTQAKSVDQLMERMEEAIALWFEVGKVSDHSQI